MYSIKYAGCRLSDFFDATPVGDYMERFTGPWQLNLRSRYALAKQIAGAVNAFAIQMQKCAAVPATRLISWLRAR